MTPTRAPRPASILLLHGLGGSGEGSVRLLEARLRALGWDDAAYLRPTVMAVHQPGLDLPVEARFKRALAEVETFLGGRVPQLTLGLSFGALLAAFSPSTLRLGVAGPWNRLPDYALDLARQRPGTWAVLQGGRDEVVPAGPALAALPPGVPATLDPEGDHGFDGWMDRIAAWAVGRWQEP